MTNLIVTNHCNQKCGFCFAQSFFVGNKEDYLSKTNFKEFLNYLDRSGINQARLLGGEPTLHPEFPTFVDLAIENRKTVLVFTNGFFSEKILNYLQKIPVEYIDLLVNVSNINSTNYNLTRQYKVLQMLASKAQLSFTISSPDFDLTPIISLIVETCCKPVIRLGIAHISKNNQFVHPKYYRFLGKKIVSISNLAASRGITIQFDCGFVRCMFSKEDLDLLIKNGVLFSWKCSTVIDINTDGTAIPCFPLGDQFKIEEAIKSNSQMVRDRIELELKSFRIMGIFPECSSCPLRVIENCSGGCLAYALTRLREMKFNYPIKL